MHNVHICLYNSNRVIPDGLIDVMMNGRNDNGCRGNDGSHLLSSLSHAYFPYRATNQSEFRRSQFNFTCNPFPWLTHRGHRVVGSKRLLTRGYERADPLCVCMPNHRPFRQRSGDVRVRFLDHVPWDSGNMPLVSNLGHSLPKDNTNTP
jgi:hypothetical protein